MHVPYDDILSRIAETPLWWSSGVPRYIEFHPRMVDVYISAALLVRGQCQACERQFTIAVAGRVRDLISETGDAIIPGWGEDPPFHYNERYPIDDQRCDGNFMSFIREEVLQAWWKAPERGIGVGGSTVIFTGRWTRLPHLEGALT